MGHPAMTIARDRGARDPCYARAGLITRAKATVPSAKTPGKSANHVPAAARAPVAAQAIEEHASANVATRDEVWRRRKWVRRAWVRNHSWIAVAEAAAARMVRAAASASMGESSA